MPQKPSNIKKKLEEGTCYYCGQPCEVSSYLHLNCAYKMDKEKEIDEDE